MDSFDYSFYRIAVLTSQESYEGLPASECVSVGSKELLAYAPKSYWRVLQRAIGVGSKELKAELIVTRVLMRQIRRWITCCVPC